MMMKKKSQDNGNGLNGIPSIISNEVVIAGEINTKDDLRVDGNIEGNIHSEGRVIIGTNGRVKGNIECIYLELMGNVSGDIKVHDLAIFKSTSIFQGEVNTANIQIEVGAKFMGNCVMKDKNVAPQPQPAQKSK